jgi:hypothetical protein
MAPTDERTKEVGLTQDASTRTSRLCCSDSRGAHPQNSATHSPPSHPLILLWSHLDSTAISLLPRQLQSLDLSFTNITDECSNDFARLTKLEYLALAKTSIGNNCVQSAVSLPSLRELDVTNTFVDDEIVGRLELRELDHIHMFCAKLTKDGLRKFRLEHPNLTIDANAD